MAESPAISEVSPGEGFTRTTSEDAISEVTRAACEVISQHEMPRLSFFIGVCEALLTAYILGAAREWLFIFGMCQWPLLLVCVVRGFRAEKNTLFLVEFCWYSNLLGWAFLGYQLACRYVPMIPAKICNTNASGQSAGCAFFAIANGPLALALLLNKNKVVFHDVVLTSGFFIHFFPVLVSWTMRWPSNASTAPLVLEGGMSAGRVWEDLYVRPLMVYLSWWVPYTIWLFIWGYRLPEKGWGSSAFEVMRPVCKKLGVPMEKPRAQVVLYSLVNLLVVSLVFFVPRIVFHSFALHTTVVVVLAISGLYQGAAYYQYAFGRRLAKEIDKKVSQRDIDEKSKKTD